MLMSVYGARYKQTWFPDHHFADSNGYVKEHRLLYEFNYKCSLLPWADVHHIDGNRYNNSILNLEAYMHGKHSALTQKGNKHCIGRHHSEDTKRRLSASEKRTKGSKQ